jgi:hypothetical protein
MERENRKMRTKQMLNKLIYNPVIYFIANPIKSYRYYKRVKTYRKRDKKLRDAKELIRLHHQQIQLDIEAG